MIKRRGGGRREGQYEEKGRRKRERPKQEEKTYLTTRSPNPQKLSSPPFFFAGPKNINILIPMVTRETTKYLCGENLRRYRRTFRSKTGINLHDCIFSFLHRRFFFFPRFFPSRSFFTRVAFSDW